MNRRTVFGARGFLQIGYSVLGMPLLLPKGYKALTYRGVRGALGRVAPVENNHPIVGVHAGETIDPNPNPHRR